jgi:HTH-type transcriptional regulator, competence development regulator
VLDTFSTQMTKRNTTVTLGSYLKDLREHQDLSLRGVEDATGISNAYLSQLEGDKIRRPSPVWLHKLSELYGVAYERLMELAGYPMPQATDTSSYSGLAARIGSITKREEDAAAEYLEFLRTKKRPGNRR